MLPFLIVSQLLPIHFIYPSCVCGRSSTRTSIDCGTCISDGLMTHFQSLQVEALMFFMVQFLNLLGSFFLFFSLCVLNGPFLQASLWLLFLIPLHFSILNLSKQYSKSNWCAYHNANWLETCVESTGAELWLQRPSCPFGWKLEPCASAFLSAVWHDYGLDEAAVIRWEMIYYS